MASKTERQRLSSLWVGTFSWSPPAKADPRTTTEPPRDAGRNGSTGQSIATNSPWADITLQIAITSPDAQPPGRCRSGQRPPLARRVSPTRPNVAAAIGHRRDRGVAKPAGGRVVEDGEDREAVDR